jgi:4-amino-4-deoxy-L-arabinose transferase-like glycosyltransferase
MAESTSCGVSEIVAFRISDLFRISRFGFRISGSVSLIVFCSVLFFLGLGDRDLTSSHEARAAQNAQMILDEGHWLVPRLFDGHLELQKPPLYYWLVALIAWMKGGPVDVWAVRLPAALSALYCVLFLFLVGVQSKRPLAGFLAALILASCLHFTWLARVGRIDMPLTTTITFALGAFYLGNLDGAARFRWHAFGYLSLGLGLLLKGPIAVVLPALVAGGAWVLHKRRFRSASLLPTPHSPLPTLWWGIPMTLAIAAPWYLWANWHTDNQLWEVFFWYHNVERGLGGSEVLKAHPWWFYFPQMAYDMLPWSLAVPVALVWFWRNREFRQDNAACLGLIWFTVIALFLSCMSFKRADYLLPAYPGMAIFLGVCAERWWRQSREIGIARHAPMLGLIIVLLIYAIGWQAYNAWLVPAEEKEWPYQTMAQEIRRQTHGPVIFFRAESHLLMHHLGRPVGTILEWENLDWWINQPKVVYFVMPEKCAGELQENLATGSLEEVLRTTDYVGGKHDRPLVVLRSRGKLASIP